MSADATAKVTVKVLPPAVTLPIETASVLCEDITNWQIEADGPDADRANLKETTAEGQTHLLQLATQLETAGHAVRWQSVAAISKEGVSQEHDHETRQELLKPEKQTAQGGYHWPTHPTILALVPHWKCESWLSRCLTSLSQQTHPLTHIVVIDDASSQPPLDIVKKFENVTLLVAPGRVGPYRLIQTVIDETDYDAYLFQDADDWSSCDRLESLLQTARTHDAELVGSQEIRVMDASSQLQAVGYPLDVNQALASSLGHPLLHPTSLVTRSLVKRAGGFATGLTFGGDTEFLLRAHWLARIVNSDRYCYFRRRRPHSLTTATATGLDSPARKALTQAIKQRAMTYVQAMADKTALESPLASLDLSPLQVAPPIQLLHKWGPALRWQKEY